jgi:hypothetical protein
MYLMPYASVSYLAREIELQFPARERGRHVRAFASMVARPFRARCATRRDTDRAQTVPTAEALGTPPSSDISGEFAR